MSRASRIPVTVPASFWVNARSGQRAARPEAGTGDTVTIHQTPPTARALTVADAMEPLEYQISDDSTVDRASDILGSAHVGYLLVRDHNGRCEGVLTSRGLHAFRSRSWYTELTPVSATTHQRGPFAWPGMGLALARLAMQIKELTVWPVVDEDGYTLGLLTADRVTGLLAVPTA
ncbi:CBS-domain-containing membrane protein [Kitasatospora sp. GAS204A]|nr:CBS-domain-containing membrane protein [Kitasatospora sp. GAS204B]